MSRRTIVGSGPARKPLPYGREAVERALACCKFWRTSQSAAVAGGIARVSRRIGWSITPEASWLPDEVVGVGLVRLRDLSVRQLRELLRGLPPRAER